MPTGVRSRCASSTPAGTGDAVDPAIYQGYEIPPFYDSLFGKLIVWALTRDEAVTWRDY
ncbi:MAG TPA: hypothetical protein VFE21_10630 [Rubrobacteraceae bacterium]|nr:hypothetical protein [Rubrobacteraceae bacterium]